jgi:hypothetical protein
MMKKVLSMAVLCGVAVMISCQTDEGIVSQNEVSEDALSKIAALGFNTENVFRDETGGYIVEGDIYLSQSDLNRTPNSTRLRIAEVEQYHTFNLVTNLPRTITVSTSGSISSGLSNAINAAIARYNNENLGITFSRVSSGGNINIRIVNTRQYIASAGFPDSQGNPYPEIKYAKAYSNYSAGFMTTVIAHEIGHCIGFRHTDYMNRSYSCGSGGNEGQETSGVGAVHIPGTPTGPDAASWMLACLSSSTDRPFNSNDKVALDYLY